MEKVKKSFFEELQSVPQSFSGLSSLNIAYRRMSNIRS
jgi:hypothetical protein